MKQLSVIFVLFIVMRSWLGPNLSRLSTHITWLCEFISAASLITWLSKFISATSLMNIKPSRSSWYCLTAWLTLPFINTALCGSVLRRGGVKMQAHIKCKYPCNYREYKMQIVCKILSKNLRWKYIHSFIFWRSRYLLSGDNITHLTKYQILPIFFRFQSFLNNIHQKDWIIISE